MKASKKNKVNNIIQMIVGGITALLFILTLYILIAGTVAMNKGTVMSVFGYTYSIVPTDSMEPEINVGDMVIGKKVSYDDLKVGDDVIYHYVYDKYDMYVVHRIIRQDENGFKTQGINPKITTEDPIYVTRDNYVSKRVWSGGSNELGSLVINHRGALFLVLILVLLLIAFNGLLDIIKTVNEHKALENSQTIEDAQKEWEDNLREEVLKEIEEEKKNNEDKNIK